MQRGALGFLGFALSALVGCGGGALSVGDGAISNANGAAGAEDPPHRGDGSPTSGGDVGADVATDDSICGSLTICDDDPDAAVREGTCQQFATSWQCNCTDGFSLNPKTNRCRRGTTCVAAAADAWPFRHPFDTSDCASRTATPCPPAPPPPNGTSPAEELVRSLYFECNVPAYLTVRIETMVACPTLLEGRGLNPTLSEQDLQALDCLTPRLAQLNVACLGASGCFMYENDTLP